MGPAPDPASLVWLEQTEPGRFTRRTLERAGRHVSLDAADYDRDGDVDLVVGGFQGGEPIAVEVWENLRARSHRPREGSGLELCSGFGRRTIQDLTPIISSRRGAPTSAGPSPGEYAR